VCKTPFAGGCDDKTLQAGIAFYDNYFAFIATGLYSKVIELKRFMQEIISSS
jgi:hypothetical protein